eukprot:g3473.t1
MSASSVSDVTAEMKRQGYRGEFDAIRIFSKEGHEFVLDRKVAMLSGTIKGMLMNITFQEAKEGKISFPEISTPVLERVIQYLHFKDKYASAKIVPDFTLEPDEVLDVLVASNFLDC